MTLPLQLDDPASAEILRRRALPHVFGTRTRSIVATLIETMLKEGGAGLAAPQIGISERIFVTIGSFSDGSYAPRVVINPRILNATDLHLCEEGCLSRKSLGGAVVERYKKITAEWVDERGLRLQAVLRGHGAQCFQHELDHLNGILIGDNGD